VVSRLVQLAVVDMTID